MFEYKVQLTRTIMLSLAKKFFAEALGISGEQLAMIDVSLVRRLGDTSGSCEGLYNQNDELVKIKIKIQEYPSDLGVIEVLAHEMVHAKQHVKNEFTFSERLVPFLYFFKMKERVKIHQGQILNDTEYYDRLCEQEAFSKSRELTHQFLDYYSDLEKNQELPNLVNSTTDPNII